MGKGTKKDEVENVQEEVGVEVPGGGSRMLHQLGPGVMKTNSCYSARGERRKGEGGRGMR